MFSLDRRQFLLALPKHVLLAAVFGAVAGALIFLIKNIDIEGQWRIALLLPIGALYVNAAILPLAIPGRHWSFAFICSMLLFLMLIAGVIIATKVNVPHSHVPGGEPLSKVNALTIGAVLTGACLGLFYGLFSDRRGAMVTGALIGAASGYTLGVFSVEFVTHSSAAWDTIAYNSALHYAWQCAGALAVLHCGGCIGAMFGARPAGTPPATPVRKRTAPLVKPKA
jgi:hypothetical protein